MIAKMQHLTLFSLGSQLEQTIHRLEDLGVLHVKFKGMLESDKITEINELIHQLETLVNFDSTHIVHNASKLEEQEFLSLVKKNYEKLQLAKELEKQVENHQRELTRLLPLGDFDLNHLYELRVAGVFIHVFQVPPDADLPLWEDVHRISLGMLGRNHLVVTIADRLLESNELIEFELPSISPAEIRSTVHNLKEEIARLYHDINEDLKKTKKNMEISLLRLKHDHLVEKVALSASDVDLDDVVYLEGYVPKVKVADIESAANESAWGYSLRDVTDTDEDIPTLIKSKPVIRLIDPLFAFLDTYPGYKEVDLSGFVLPFFVLFYAMLIGDAGYGLVLLVAVLIFRKKIPSLAFMLMSTLSLATIVWGVLSGTYFGAYGILEAFPVLVDFIYLPIASFGAQLSSNFNSDAIWRYCFIIGATQICLGYFIAFVKNINQPSSLSRFGWLLLVAGAYHLVLFLLLGTAVPQYAYMLMGIGFFSVILFDQQVAGQNWFTGILKGLMWMPITFLDSISAFASIISYIRLYAVGLASVAIASSFNDMALPLLQSSSLGGIIGGSLILLAAHSLNLVMGLLAVIVHGVRLNLLEFAGSAGLEWSGLKYSPLKK